MVLKALQSWAEEIGLRGVGLKAQVLSPEHQLWAAGLGMDTLWSKLVHLVQPQRYYSSSTGCVPRSCVSTNITCMHMTVLG